MLKTRTIKCLALGALLLALCTASTVSHGFSQKTIQNDMQSAAEALNIEELFPRFTATASPSGHASAFSLEVLAPSESGELWLRWQNGRIAVTRGETERRRETRKLPAERLIGSSPFRLR